MKDILIKEIKKYTKNDLVIDLAVNLEEENLKLVIEKYRIITEKNKIIDYNVLDAVVYYFIEESLVNKNPNYYSLMRCEAFLSKINEFSLEEIEEIVSFSSKKCLYSDYLSMALNDQNILHNVSGHDYVQLLRIQDRFTDSEDFFCPVHEIMSYLAKRKRSVTYISSVIDLAVKNKEKCSYIKRLSIDDNFNELSTEFSKLFILTYVSTCDSNYRISLLEDLISKQKNVIQNEAKNIINFIEKVNLDNLENFMRFNGELFDYYTLDEMLVIINELFDNNIACELIQNYYLREALTLDEIMYLYHGLGLCEKAKYKKFMETIQAHKDLLPEKNAFSALVALFDYESYRAVIKEYLTFYVPDNILSTLSETREKYL